MRGKHRLSAMLRVAAVLCAVVVSLDMTWRTFPAHGDEYTHDARVAAWLHGHNPRGRPVLVLDPPLFSYLDDGAYVAAPSDGVASDLAVARRYGARYWVLDPLHSAAQDPLYRGRVHSPALRRVAVVDGAQVYRISCQLPVASSSCAGAGIAAQSRASCNEATYASWHLAPGTWHLAPGTWHLAPGTWRLAPGT